MMHQFCSISEPKVYLAAYFVVVLSSLGFPVGARGDTVIHRYDFQGTDGIAAEGWTPIQSASMAAPGTGGFVGFGTVGVYNATRDPASTQEPVEVTTDFIYTGTTDVEGELAMQFRDYAPPKATNVSVKIYTTDPTDSYSRNYQTSLSSNDDAKTKSIIWNGSTSTTDPDYQGTAGYYAPIVVPSFSLPGTDDTNNFVDVSFESIGVAGGTNVRVNGIEFEYTTK